MDEVERKGLELCLRDTELSWRSQGCNERSLQNHLAELDNELLKSRCVTQDLINEKVRSCKASQMNAIFLINSLESALEDICSETYMANQSLQEIMNNMAYVVVKYDSELNSARNKFERIHAEISQMMCGTIQALETPAREIVNMTSGGSFTDFGELVLVIGDFHIPHGVADIPQVFKELLNTDKIRTVLCTGNLGSEDMLGRLRQITPNIYIAKGDMDHNIRSVDLPDHHVLQIGQFRVGLIHGHQIIPTGDQEALAAFQRKLDVDILVSGCTHRNEIFQSCFKFFVNPGSATGAPNLSVNPTAADVPSFMLMAIQGPSAVVYVYEFVDGAAKVALSEFTKTVVA